jgi:hypothetical protein
MVEERNQAAMERDKVLDRIDASLARDRRPGVSRTDFDSYTRRGREEKVLAGGLCLCSTLGGRHQVRQWIHTRQGGSTCRGEMRSDRWGWGGVGGEAVM